MKVQHEKEITKLKSHYESSIAEWAEKYHRLESQVAAQQSTQSELYESRQSLELEVTKLRQQLQELQAKYDKLSADYNTNLEQLALLQTEVKERLQNERRLQMDNERLRVLQIDKVQATLTMLSPQRSPPPTTLRDISPVRASRHTAIVDAVACSLETESSACDNQNADNTALDLMDVDSKENTENANEQRPKITLPLKPCLKKPNSGNVAPQKQKRVRWFDNGESDTPPYVIYPTLAVMS